MKNVLDYLGGRKFVLSLMLMVTGLLVDILSARGLSENYLYLLMSVSGLFTIGNVTGKFSTKPTVTPKEEDV